MITENFDGLRFLKLRFIGQFPTIFFSFKHSFLDTDCVENSTDLDYKATKISSPILSKMAALTSVLQCIPFFLDVEPSTHQDSAELKLWCTQ